MSWELKREAAITEAAAKGLSVVYANDLTLQLDIDSHQDLDFAEKALKQFKQVVGWTGVSMTRSRSNLWHIYVTLESPLPRKDRIILQGCLGSDRKREILNWNYLQNGGDGEMFLFEQKDQEPKPYALEWTASTRAVA